MEDVDDGEGDAEADGDADGDLDADGDGDGDDGEGDEGEGEGEGDGEGEDEDNEGDEDEEQDEPDSPSAARMQSRGPSRPLTSPRPLPNGTLSTSAAHSRAPSGSHHPASLTTSPRASSTGLNGLPFCPSIRPEALTAGTYDIVPTIAAPHSTSINVVTATPDMRYVFSGGTDGYIRKFNWVDSANGKLMLTVAQRHPFVDSVTKAGVLLSYWENEDAKDDTPSRQSYEDPIVLSPVYSLAVQNQALWLLSGTESGGINMQSVRHSEGTKITTLRQHTSAVSVLHLAQDERSVLSGGWDKTINDWDLNTGQVKRTFTGSGGQISAIEPRPLSTLPVPEDSGLPILTNGTFSSNNGSKPKPNGVLSNGVNGAEKASQGDTNTQDAPGSPDDDMNSLFGDDDAGGIGAPSMPLGDDDEDDEFSRAIATGLQQQTEEDADIEMEDSGGPVLPPSEAPVSADANVATETTTEEQEAPVIVSSDETTDHANGLPHSEETQVVTNGLSTQPDAPPTSDSTFLDASFDGAIRIWDRRQPNPIARITPPRGIPPWCMSACWSPDGNFIYAGRRNNAVDEYSLHKGFREPTRTFKFPSGSGPVSAVRTMPNGKHLVW